MSPSRSTAVLLALALLSGCGPQCPAAGAIRDDLPATASEGEMTVTLQATRIAQANDSPAVLFLRWSRADEVQLTISDAYGNVLSHPSATAQRTQGEHGQADFSLIRLQDARGAALQPGLYAVTVATGAASRVPVPVPVRVPVPITLRFEIVHCALYY